MYVRYISETGTTETEVKVLKFMLSVIELSLKSETAGM